MKEIFKVFRSRKLALVLITIIVMVSIVGTVIQQNAAKHVYIEIFGQGGYRFLKITGITNLYHSWWFNLLFGLFSLNIIVCSLDRLKKKFRSFRRTEVDIDEKRISSMRNFESFELKADLQNVLKILKKNNYRVRVSDSGKSKFITAEKGFISEFGSSITHLSILVIFLGVAIGLWWGFKTSININEGEIVNVPNAEFQLRLDKFVIEYYGDTDKPKDYKSTLTVIENGKEKLTRTIEVNYPLKYKGIVFYQSSYGEGGEVDSLEIDLARRDSPHSPTHLSTHKIHVGESFGIPDTDYEVKVAGFFPDFVMNRSGKASNRSNKLNNPTVLLKVFKKGKFLFDIWSFMKFGVPHLPKDFDYTPILTKVYSKAYSGLQVVHDPGVPVVWFGCGLIVIGLFVSFYTYHRRLWVICSQWDTKMTVKIGGRANKNLPGFEGEFGKLINQIKGGK